MPFRYHQSSNIYSRQLVEEFKTAYTNFQVLQGKIASIISDSDLKKYTDGSSTWYSAYSNVVQTVDGINITLGQHTTQIATDGQTIASHTSKLAEYKSTIDEHTSQISSVQQDYNTLSGQYSTLNQTVSGIKTEVGDFKTEVQNNYATQSWANSTITQSARDIKLEVKTMYMTNAYLEYAKGTSSTTAPTSGWSTSSPQWEEGKYIWQRTAKVINGSTTYSNTCCIQGAMGNGISSITNHYLATSASSGVTRDTSGWTTTVQAVTASKRYLWNYESTTYTSGSSVPTDPHIIGVYGEAGATGNGISNIVEYYAISSSNSTAPADNKFSTSVQTTTVDNRYLWNYEKITYTNGSTKSTDKRVIGTYGETGRTGVGVSSIVPEYYLSTSSSTQTGGSWVTSPPAYIAGRYYWTRQKITYTDSSTGTSTAVLDTELNEVAGRSKISVQTSAPSNPKAGDVWIDSDDRNIMYKYNGSSWETIRDTFVADLSAIFYKSGTTTTADTIMSTLMTTDAFGAVLQVAEMGLTRDSDGKITGKISADRIKLEGVTTINNYFKIKTDGKIECIGGTLAGWTIDSSAIYKNTDGTNNGSCRVRMYSSTNPEDGAFSVFVRYKNNWVRRAAILYNGAFESTDYQNTSIRTYIADGYIICRREALTSKTTPRLVLNSYGLTYWTAGTSEGLEDINASITYYHSSTSSSCYLSFDVQSNNPMRIYGATIDCYRNIDMHGHFVINESDARLKTNINQIKEDNVLSKINALKVKSFDWKENGEHVKAGLIAQDLQEVFPELVSKNRDGYLGINKTGLIEYIILAIQELNKKIEEK